MNFSLTIKNSFSLNIVIILEVTANPVSAFTTISSLRSSFKVGSIVMMSSLSAFDTMVTVLMTSEAEVTRSKQSTILKLEKKNYIMIHMHYINLLVILYFILFNV